MLRQARCNNVVCCVPDRPALLENFGIKYCQVPLSDSPGASTELRQAIDTACGFIEDARSRGEGVVVHCNVGMSRSASVVIGYLIMSQRWSYERAYVHTKMIRGCILPNAGFEVVLAEMGEEFCPAREMPSPGVPSPELARREEEDAEATPVVRLAAGGVPADTPGGWPSLATAHGEGGPKEAAGGSETPAVAEETREEELQRHPSPVQPEPEPQPELPEVIGGSLAQYSSGVERAALPSPEASVAPDSSLITIPLTPAERAEVNDISVSSAADTSVLPPEQSDAGAEPPKRSRLWCCCGSASGAPPVRHPHEDSELAEAAGAAGEGGGEEGQLAAPEAGVTRPAQVERLDMQLQPDTDLSSLSDTERISDSSAKTRM